MLQRLQSSSKQSQTPLICLIVLAASTESRGHRRPLLQRVPGDRAGSRPPKSGVKTGAAASERLYERTADSQPTSSTSHASGGVKMRSLDTQAPGQTPWWQEPPSGLLLAMRCNFIRTCKPSKITIRLLLAHHSCPEVCLSSNWCLCRSQQWGSKVEWGKAATLPKWQHCSAASPGNHCPGHSCACADSCRG